jgi:hypothetical protein
MWDKLKTQIIDKILSELESEQTWNMIELHIIKPLMNKFNGYTKKYIIIFICIQALIIMLLLLNIFLTIYTKNIITIH